MSTLRWLARLSVPVMLSAASVATATTASADPADDAFLTQVRALGINFPPERDQAVVAVAHLICYDHSWGYTPDAIASDVHQILNPRGVSVGDVRSVVDLAIATYCPG